MKLFVAFGGSEGQARFVLLINGSETVAALRKRIVSDYRAVFPSRPPLCFFRMASADGFFLTDSAPVADVLEEGSTVTCHRADEEAASCALPDETCVEDILATFRAQVTYVARAACHAALRPGGEKLDVEAMSVVLAMLLMGGKHLEEVRATALSALQRSFSSGTDALPAFIAAGGLFVLLSLLSPSTHMDSRPEVLDGAAQLLERLATDHSDAMAPLLRDCQPSVLLQKLALDSRVSAAVQRRALCVRRLLERAPPRPAPRRPQSSDRLRAAGAAVAAKSGGYGDAARPAGRSSGAAVSPALALRTLVEHGAGDAELQRRLFAQLGADHGDLRELARSPALFEALFLALLTFASPGGDASALAPLGRLLARLVGDAPCRAAVVRRFGEHLPGGLEALKEAWPFLPTEMRTPLLDLLGDVAPVAALLDGAPEELQVVGLRTLRAALDAGSPVTALTPKAVNVVLLRLIPRQPLLCLDTLAALALQEEFRSFFGAQMSLLQLLAHCCQQPEAVAASAGGVEVASLQRAAARALANLSSHPAAREWVKRSALLRGALASADDFAVRAYLAMALGVDASAAAEV